MILASKFDILRGWPREGAIDETFPVHLNSGVPVVIPSGMVVTQGTDGAMTEATSPNVSSADALPVWVVIEGNDDFSGQMLAAVVCIRSNAELRLDPANFVAGAYVPGSLLSYNAGQFTLAVTNNQVIGEVLENDVATDGTLRILFTAGSTKKV